MYMNIFLQQKFFPFLVLFLFVGSKFYNFAKKNISYGQE